MSDYYKCDNARYKAHSGLPYICQVRSFSLIWARNSIITLFHSDNYKNKIIDN